MKSTLLSALPFVFALSACTNSNNASIGKNSARESIFDGQVTSGDSLIASTTVLIISNNNGSLSGCTGSVLSPTVILTAGHCVSATDEKTQVNKLLRPSDIGIYDAKKVDALPMFSSHLINQYKLASAEKTVAHSIYMNQGAGPAKAQSSSGYDIALIKLDRALPDSYKPAMISNDFSDLTKNQIRVAGFGGHTNTPSYDSTDFKLRDGKVKINTAVNEYIFSNQGKELALITVNTPLSTQLSFKKNSSDASVCHGDSGGPLYYEKNGEIHLVGVNVAIESQKTCVDNSTSSQFSVSLVGPQIHFVSETYKELTGKSLGVINSTAVQDERAFENQLISENVNPENNVASLKGYTWLPDDQGQLMLIDEELANVACRGSGSGDSKHMPGLVIYMENRSTQILDGKTAVSLLTFKDGSPERVLEARMKMTGANIRMVILTREGYISADIPVLKCL